MEGKNLTRFENVGANLEDVKKKVMGKGKRNSEHIAALHGMRKSIRKGKSEKKALNGPGRRGNRKIDLSRVFRDGRWKPKGGGPLIRCRSCRSRRNWDGVDSGTDS